MSKEIGFSYGIMCADIETQANEQGYTLGDKAEMFEKLRYSVNMVCINRLVSDSQADNIYKKMHKKVLNALKPLTR